MSKAKPKPETANQPLQTTDAIVDGGGSENGAEVSPKPDPTPPQPQTTGAATNGGAGVQTETEAPRKSKAPYRVGDCPVLHDHEVYQPGDELELTEADAARLGSKVTAL